MKDKSKFFNYNPKNNNWMHKMYLDYLDVKENAEINRILMEIGVDPIILNRKGQLKLPPYIKRLNE